MTRQHPEDDAPEAAREWARLVAYVQEQMIASERADFERELRANPDLQARQRELAADHRRLARLLPAADWTDAELEARVLQAWTKDQPGVAARTAHVAPAARWWWAYAAAAAALLVAGVVWWRAPGDWALPPPMLHIAGLRGDEAAPAALTRETMERLDEELVRSLHRALQSAAKGKRVDVRAWSLHRDYHGLAGSSFRLEISLRRTGQDVAVQSWSQLYASEAAFREEGAVLSERVAEGVVLWATKVPAR